MASHNTKNHAHVFTGGPGQRQLQHAVLVWPHGGSSSPPKISCQTSEFRMPSSAQLPDIKEGEINALLLPPTCLHSIPSHIVAKKHLSPSPPDEVPLHIISHFPCGQGMATPTPARHRHHQPQWNEDEVPNHPTQLQRVHYQIERHLKQCGHAPCEIHCISCVQCGVWWELGLGLGLGV